MEKYTKAVHRFTPFLLIRACQSPFKFVTALGAAGFTFVIFESNEGKLMEVSCF